MTQRDSNTTVHQRSKNNNVVLKPKSRSAQYVSIPLQESPSPSARKSPQDATLRDAIAWKDYALCLRLLDEGADVNATDEDGATPLHILARKYSKTETRARRIPSLLLERGANVYARDKNGESPLHIAARGGLEELCQVFLEFMASRSPQPKVDLKNKKNMTALHFAAQQGYDGIVKKLLDAGADPLATDSQKFLPIHHAAVNGYFKCCQVLSPHYPGDAKMDPKVPTPLLLSAKLGFHKCIEVMPADKIDFNRQDPHGNNALHIACRLGFEKTVKFLIDMKCNMNHKNKARKTPLMEAVTKWNTSCLLVLLENGAKVDEVTKDKKSVLHFAADKKSHDCMEQLLMNGGVKKIIDLKDCDGCTALHIAIKRDSERCALLLLRAGASVDIACNNKLTPLHLAAESAKTGVIEYLLAKNPQDLNAENLNKETPFLLAAKRGLRDICMLLLRKGARSNAVNKHGQSALHLSSYHGHTSVVKMLIKRGIDKRHRDEVGSLALHAAAAKGHQDCCKVLVEADKLASREKNKKGIYPIDYAFNKGHNNVFKFLLHSLPFKNYSTLPQDLREKLHRHTHKALKDRNKVAVEAIVNSPLWEAGFGADRKHGDTLCTNFRELIKHYPCIAQKVMDKCTTACPTTKVKSHDFRLFEDNYFLKKDKRKNPSDESENPFHLGTWKVLSSAQEVVHNDLQWKADHPVSLMVQYKCPQLLQHPLTKAWFSHKWRSYTRFIFVMMLLMQALYVAALVAFMITVWNWNQIKKEYNQTEAEFCREHMRPPNLNSSKNISDVSTDSGEKTFDPTPSHICHAVMCFVFALQLMLETNNFVKLRWYYFNYMSFITLGYMGLTILMLLPTSLCSLELGIKSVYIWECGVFAILLACIGLLGSINRLPSLSVFTAMTRDFVMSYLKGLSYVGAVLLVFALIFHLLLSDQMAFSTMPQAAVKTFVWMLGDLAYEDTFIDKPLDYPYVIKYLFLIFLFTIAAFIVMLLRAPSSDANKLIFFRLARQAEMFLTTDVCFPSFRRSFAVGKLTDREHGSWFVHKLEKAFDRRQPGAWVVQNLSINAEKMGLIDVREFRQPQRRHWLVMKAEELLHWFTGEEEEEVNQDFPNVLHEKLSDQTNKLDQLLLLYNQLHDNYQKQNEQIIELKNQLDNIKSHTY